MEDESRTLEVFFDESGYTGDDLLNGDQPVFVLASSDLSDVDARRFIKEYFNGIQADELKHSTLASRPRGQQRIVEFIRATSDSGHFAVAVFHKEFVLVTTIVEWWVEESTRRHGINLYDRGGNIGLSNLIYLSLWNLLPRLTLRAHLARYQAMMRQRSRSAYDGFWEPLWTLFDISDRTLRDTLMWALGAQMDFGFEHLAALPDRVLNVTPSALLNLAQHWKKRHGRTMRFVHDASRDLAREKELWKAILSPEVPQATVGYDRRQIAFPLGVEEICFAQSEENPALQLPDIVAGATSVIARNGLDATYRPGYAEKLNRAGLNRLPGLMVWPDSSVTPQQLGTTGRNAGGDPVDFIASMILKRSRTL